MPAGLVDIISYGSQDLFLTGTPEITFYKVVYRRHTNFTIESFEIPFDTNTGFGLTSDVVLKPIGDLIHTMYLKIKLPKIKLDRIVHQQDVKKSFQDLNKMYNQYQKCLTFMNVNANAYRAAIDLYSASNIFTSEEMVDIILKVFEDYICKNSNCYSVDNPLEYINESKYNLYLIALHYKKYIGTQDPYFDPVILPKQHFKNLLDHAMSYSQQIQLYYDQELNNAILFNKEVTNKNLKFAWTDRIGHAIIDYVDMYIGSEKIDRQYGIWMNVWYELSGKKNQNDNYMKMIGNVPELTTFDRTEKPEYTLYIPLQFWFCRFNGLSLPLCALQYSHVSFSVKLRTFKECAYIEKCNETLNQSFNQSFNIDNICIDNENNRDSTGYRRTLEASLLVDYVYLDAPERKRFAQASHEYLIEQVQVIQIDDIDKESTRVELDFIRPCKELIWILQKQAYINNKSGFVKCRWDNYTPNKNNKSLSIDYATLDFNGYSRFDRFNGMYFNYVQPFNHHSNTPSDGINVYSFALKPEEQQPTGSCNFSRISKAILNLWINPDMFYYSESDNVDHCNPKLSDKEVQTKLNLWIFARSYNILRIISGTAGLAYI